MENSWICERCHENILKLEDGCVEWLRENGSNHNYVLKSFKILHKSIDSSAQRCQYNQDLLKTDGKVVVEEAIEKFIGVNGLVHMLTLIESEKMPESEFIELVKRFQVPGYEQIRGCLQGAIEEGVVSEINGLDDIKKVMAWLKRKPV